MPNDSGKIPWPKINDFMMKMLTIRDIDQFSQKAIAELETLVPYESAISGRLWDNGFVHLDYLAGESNPETSAKMIRNFNEYYCYIVPGFSQGLPNVNEVCLVECYDIRDTEYYNDFQRPYGVRRTANLLHLGNPGYSAGIISLARERFGLQFTDREKVILGIIQPHLSNLYCILRSLSQFDYLNLAGRLIFRFPVLTKREAEITAMIYQKFSTAMISSQLLIRPHSVHKHVENIFGKLSVRSRKELIAKLSAGLKNA